MDDVKQTLKLLRLDEIWEDIQSMRLLSRFRPMPIRKMLKERSKKIYELVLPQMIVFGGASLDAFLKLKFEQATGHEYGGNFQRTDKIKEGFEKYVEGGDIFGGDEKLKKDLQKVFNKRHVIAHRAGVIDDTYRKKCTLDEAWINRKLPLDAETVENDLTTIEKFGEIANKIIKVRR